MRDFYQRLWKDPDKVLDAFRGSQIKMITEGDFDSPNPYFWAAFQVSGDPGDLRGILGQGR